MGSKLAAGSYNGQGHDVSGGAFTQERYCNRTAPRICKWAGHIETIPATLESTVHPKGVERMRWENVRRATSLRARPWPTSRGQHTRVGMVDRPGHPTWLRGLVQRYGLALVLAGLGLMLRAVLPFKEGTAIFQLPLAAVVVSAWYGGRGPGLLASLVSAIGALYLFVPPRYSFALSPDFELAFVIFITLCLLLSEFGAGRRRTEHALRGSEERFRTVVQFSFDMYWETDAQHRYVRQEFSESLAAAARDSEIERTSWEIPSLEPDEESWRKHHAALDARLPFRDFELVRLRSDGSELHLSLSGMPVFDDFGRFVGYRGVGRHIRERKLAEAEHRAYVRFLESMDRINRRAMHGTSDIERTMSDVLEETLEIFECDRAWLLYPCDPDAPSWRAVMERTRPEFPGAAAGGRDLPMTGDSAQLARAALDFGGCLPAGPGHERAVRPEISERFGVRSEILVALRPTGDRAFLFGLHQCSKDRTWTKDEQRLFEEVGHRLTATLSSLIAFRSLRASESRLEAAQRLAHVGWWERDYATGHVSLSDETCRIFGVQPVDLPLWQERWLTLIHPEDRARAAAASEAALAGSRRYDVEYRVVRPDGTVGVVHSQGDVTRDEAGRPVRQFGVMQDITELRQAEEELRAGETRFRALVDHATDSFFLHAVDSTVVDINQQACVSLGYSRAELLGMQPRQFDVGLDQAFLDQVPERLAKGEVLTFETVHRRKDGVDFPVEVRVRQFQYGERALHVSLVRDIAERKAAEAELRASEQRFRTFVDRASDAFFLMDEEFLLVDVNLQACRSLGWSREELIGLHPRTFDVGLDDERMERQAAQMTSGVSSTFETRHRRKDGTSFAVEIRTGTFTQSGEIYYLALVRDISERKLAEQTLRAKDDALQIARTELARVSRLTTLGELTTSIAHEVGQPLGAMVASAGASARWLAADPPAMAEARAALDNIVADGKRAREVIGRIRALAKRQVPRKDFLDINQQIREVVALTGQELRSHDVVLATKLDEVLPEVSGDRVQLQQVLLNLIVNAIEAMSTIDDRSRELTIISRRVGTDAVLVEVHDSGNGLEPQLAERVFEAFYTTKAEGIGIGLSISRSIIEEHGGRLWATPNEPHGAVFQFSLPPA